VNKARRLLRLVTSLTTASVAASSALIVVGVVTAPSASGLPSTPAPIREPGTRNVTADALPTAQIDGVVWSQTIIGSTVYAGGKFSYARPAGAAPGTQRVRRTNLLAYNIVTGVLAAFAPTLNGQVKTVARSPDGSRIYVGGEFTNVNGYTRSRIAAFATATGALISTFAPTINSTVNAIAASDARVYVGGTFTAVGASPRARLAAFSVASGTLLGWQPRADSAVLTVVIAPGAPTLIVGGSFLKINTSTVYGLGAVDRFSGAGQPFAANARVRNYGPGAAIYSLSTDGSAIYGTAYAFHTGGGQGTLEGTFSANPATGVLNWVEDCNGDTYGAYSVNGVVYTVGHAHDCATVGGFPDNPGVAHRALAFTTAAAGTLSHRFSVTYTDWGGTPAPAMYNWFPDLQAGTYTGQSQAAWAITGNGTYVVMGGEFTAVNGVSQQGLVRFAIRPPAPGVQGPRVTVAPTLRAVFLDPTSVKITWPTSWDRDNENLTYRVIRNGNVAAPVHTVLATSQFWNRPTLSFTDTGLKRGTRYAYRIRVSDPRGNSLTSADVSIITG
jgi:hypothetical protein